MTKEQKEFLHLHIIEQINYKTISETLNIPGTTLIAWYEELKEERTRMVSIKSLMARKQLSIPFYDFYEWYFSRDRKCHYCGITEKEIDLLLKNGLLRTKRISTRGRKLELDRKEADLKYDNLENIVLSCYWCNNAKTDTFTCEEFLEVGKVFSNIWKKRLQLC